LLGQKEQEVRSKCGLLKQPVAYHLFLIEGPTSIEPSCSLWSKKKLKKMLKELMSKEIIQNTYLVSYALFLDLKEQEQVIGDGSPKKATHRSNTDQILSL